MRKHLDSHFDSGTVTLDTKFDQIIIPWSFLTYFLDNFPSYRENRHPKTRFWPILPVCTNGKCWIVYFYMTNLNWGVIGTIDLYVSYYFVAGRLVGVLVDLPILRVKSLKWTPFPIQKVPRHDLGSFYHQQITLNRFPTSNWRYIP